MYNRIEDYVRLAEAVAVMTDTSSGSSVVDT